jgi:hypothetical protein
MGLTRGNIALALIFEVFNLLSRYATVTPRCAVSTSRLVLIQFTKHSSVVVNTHIV